MLIDIGDGGRLEVVTVGPPQGRPLVLHLPTVLGPGDLPLLTEPAAARGLRTVICGRPGYSSSTPRPGRSVASSAADIGAVLDYLGHAEFVTVGWSEGGPHALAGAALLPGRCAAAASVNGVAPYDADGLDWRTGIEDLQTLRAAMSGPGALIAALEPIVDQYRLVNDAVFAAAWARMYASEYGLGELVGALVRLGLSRGAAGWRDDYLALVRPWGFDVAAIGAPVAIWQGFALEHGAWLAARIPGARARLDAEAGRLGHLADFGAILDDLLDAAGW
ncbi:alpha/beta hydrolase [Dactylosporangium sp. CS-047395]|uniref:alpha/beta hydrolase n=1 Tax=Dactylosporangium sp. CS-047395 TaxID=3239936 RepID=UPI003D94A74C